MEIGGYRLGIDFGTSTTVAFLADPHGRVRPLLFDSSPLLPSAVFAAPDGALLTGLDAERAGTALPAGLDANPKRAIDDGTVWLGERAVTVTDLIAAVLARVAQEAFRVAGQAPRSVVLTHPAVWSTTRLAVLADAARRAGLGAVTLVPEPVAAAAYFTTILCGRIGPDRVLVVYDLGAGTFDVSAVGTRSGNGLVVLGTAGLDDVGGMDLDAAVVAHVRGLTAADHVTAWRGLDWPQTPAERQARHALWRAARQTKEQLSRHATAELHVPLVERRIHLTRAEFESAAGAILDRTAALTVALVRDFGIPAERLGGVFLVGGSSRIPLVASLLHRGLGTPPTVIDQPELVVAEGSLHTIGRAAAAAVGSAPVISHPAARLSRRALVLGAALGTAALASAGGAAIWAAGRNDPGDPRANPSATGSPPPSTVAARWNLPNRPATGGRESGQHISYGLIELAYHPLDPNILATSGTDDSVRLWDLTARRTIGNPLAGHSGYVRSVAFSPDGKLLASAGNDGTVRLWHVGTRTPAGDALTDHNDIVYCVRFSPDGTILASASADNTIRLWDVATRTAIGAPLTGHSNSVIEVAFQPPDGKLLASNSWDESARLWDVGTHAPVGRIMTEQDEEGICIAFSPDGKLLAGGGNDNSIWLWDPATQEPVGVPLEGHTGGIISVAFSPDGRTLASGGGSKDGTIRLWDVERRVQIGEPLRGHTASVISIAYRPDGKQIASSGNDDAIRLWDIDY